MTSRIIVTFQHVTTGERVRLYIKDGVEITTDANGRVFNQEESEIVSVRIKDRGVVTFDGNYSYEAKEVEPEDEEVVVETAEAPVEIEAVA